MQTILIVDDDRIQIAKNKAFFCNAGYQTLQARTPDEAMDCFRYHNIDLLFTDLIMPGIDGIELFRQICERFDADCPAILQTAYLNPKVRAEAKDAQFFAFLPKTAKQSDVLEQVQNALQRQQVEQR